MSHNLFKKVEQTKPVVKASAERSLEQNIDQFNKVMHSLKSSPQRYSVNQKIVGRSTGSQIVMTEKTQATQKGNKPSQMYSASALSHSIA